jgi:putative ABC transport system permease protein
MKELFHTIVARLRGFLRSRSLDSDFNHELEAHLAMSTEDKIRRGMTPEDARREARLELGGLTQLREAGRAARGLPWLESFALDIRFGLRMLCKSWGVTLIGGLAMAIAVAIGASVFAIVHACNGDTLPLEEGDRVVRLVSRGRAGGSTSVDDFEWWRQRMRSVTDISAFTTSERFMNTPNGGNARVSVAQMTASGFRVARVQPLAGRPLLDEDERDGAPRTTVLSYDIWQSCFGARSEAIGQTVQLGGVDYIVVGIMPEDFAFPVRHQVWIPFHEVRGSLSVFGRLAPGATFYSAQAELAVTGAAPRDGGTREEMRVRVAPYADSFRGGLIVGPAVIWLEVIPILLALLLVPPCANIAILVYARNVARQHEFAARYVLGAGRGRIIGQLMIEALVLAGAAAGVGLVMAHGFLKLFQSEIGQNFPFWVKPHISMATVVYVTGLAAFAALVAGGLPALRSTGGLRRSGFHSLGSLRNPRLGVTWTVLVVLQVALSTAVLPRAGELMWMQFHPNIIQRNFAPEQYLTAQVELQDERPRLRDLQTELVREARARLGVSSVTVSAAIDGIDEPLRRIETDVAGQQQWLAGSNQVDAHYFDVFEASLLGGRSFENADFEVGRRVVIVNRTFAEQLLSGNPLGQRLRYLDDRARDSESWYEIVGLVDEIAANTARPRIYHPVLPGQLRKMNLTLRVGPTVPSGFARQLIGITMGIDPNLQLVQLRNLNDVYQQEFREDNTLGLSVATIVLIVVLFAAAGIHTLVAFAVAQRRREIGIRCALGASPLRLVADVFRRDLSPVVAGAAVGILLAMPIDKLLSASAASVSTRSVFATFLFIIAVGVLAVAGPARRLLRIDSTEALRES